jgi:C4-dicarboxylate transporter DctQ subunit
MPNNRKITREGFELDRILMSCLLFIMALVTFGEVIARFLFHAPLAHISEIVPNLFVWMTFLGIAVAEKENAHLGISLFDLHSGKLKRTMDLLVTSGKGLFYLMLTLYGLRFFLHSLSRGEMTSFGIPAWVFILAVPVGGLIIVSRLILSRTIRDDS